MGIIILSSLLYTISFIVPNLTVALLLFPLAIPISQYTFMHGILWGIFTFSLHTSGIFYAIVNMHTELKIPLFILTTAVIGYLSLHSGIWFFIIKKIHKTCSISVHFFVITSLVHAIFFWYLCYACFLPLGIFEGYPLANPLLPLISLPAVELSVRYIGFFGSLFLFFLITTMPRTFKTVNHWCYYAVFIMVLRSITPDTSEPIPPLIDTILPLSIQFSNTKNSLYPFEWIQAHLQYHPQKKIIISPESAFYCHELFSEIPIKMLQRPSAYYILGSFSHHTRGMYNTLYLISDGAIHSMHHKQHTVFTESTPQWPSFFRYVSLYKKGFDIEKAPIKHDVWNLGSLVLEPYLCSEFFCHCMPPHPLHHNSTILLCCNDSWFTGHAHYVSCLMVADARFKALLWKKDILYIGYQNALFISSHAIIYQIPSK